ncbi:ets-4 [Pristionchus pacificus]|uniref:Ets-4 n=1 Tax=Pristionchus pacificus TaxID=54126 RepID=A0A2A6CUG4_PRIPA|nr:ets-4 [Pristionchus pacificus]|eukprot:PDM81726.1 ets-4 [Pristionchus pacificus]
MNSLLTCSIDDHLQSNSWNSSDLSPSQLSDDDEFDAFPASYPSFTESSEDSIRDNTSFDETATNPSDESEYQKKSGDDDCFPFNPQTTQQSAESLLESTQKQEMWELAQRQNMQDYTTVCANLQLPLNISTWTPDQTARWIHHRVDARNLPLPSSFCISGVNLTKMTIADFDIIFPMGGDQIHEDVQLWKQAFETYASTHGQSMQSGCLTAADNGMMVKQEWISNDRLQNDNNNYCSHQQPQQQQGLGGDQQHQQMMYNQQMHHGYYHPQHQQQQHHHQHPNALVTQQQQQQHAMVPHQQQLMPGPPQSMPHPPQQFFPQFPVANSVPTDSESDGDEMNEDDDMSLLPPPPYMPEMMQQSLPRQPYHRTGGNVHLWIFIRELLECPDQYGGCVRWVDRLAGTFKIENSQVLAQFWGIRKNRSAMNYDKLSRSLRQYYKKGIIQKPEKKQRLVYRFLPPYNL